MLSSEEQETLAPWDDGSYLCPRQRGACNDRCAKSHDHLSDIVQALIDSRLEAAAEAIEALHVITVTQMQDQILADAAALVRGLKVPL